MLGLVDGVAVGAASAGTRAVGCNARARGPDRSPVLRGVTGVTAPGVDAGRALCRGVATGPSRVSLTGGALLWLAVLPLPAVAGDVEFAGINAAVDDVGNAAEAFSNTSVVAMPA